MKVVERIQAIEGLLQAGVSEPLRSRIVDELRRLLAAVHEGEQQLRDSEERYRGLVEASSEGILIAADQTIVEVNQVVCEMSGYSREEMIGKGPMDFMTPESGRLSIELAKRGHTDAYVIDGIRKNGELMRVEIHGRNIVYRGRPARVTSLRDVTERERREQQLREEQRRFDEQVQQAQKLESIAVLAGGVAHDFNNLLLAIMGNCELATLSTEPGSRARSALQQIQVAAHNAADLTRQLLAYSGRGRFVMTPISLNDVVTEMQQLLRASIPKKVAIIAHLQPELRGVNADPGQLRQVVMNLITNAAEAIDRERGVITVRTAHEQIDAPNRQQVYLPEPPKPGAYVRLEVSDNGKGMDGTTAGRAFEPFFSTKFTGRGLGLAAVLGIVRGHGGALTVRSKPGEGTRFDVYFPALDAPVASTSVASVPPPAALSREACVLLVDDEPAVLEVATHMLEELGLSVIAVSSGQAAIDTFERQRDRITAVLLDLTMPDLSGEETLASMRAHDPKARVVLTSGYSLAEQAPLAEGAAGFLQKPYTLARLRKALAAVLPDGE